MHWPVALTFDDGPWPQGTEPILDLLGARGIQATFYVWGEQASKHPELVRAMVGGGHSVQPHCWSHASHQGATREWIQRDIDQVLTLLGELGVESPQFWRPPWGRWQPGATDRIARDRGLELTGWTIDSSDYAGKPAPEMLSAINAELEAADDIRQPVVLMHDCPLEPGQWQARQSVNETIRLLQLLLDDDRRAFCLQAARVPNHLDPPLD